MPATVERGRRVLDRLIGSGRSAREESAADPGQQRVTGDVVRSDDNDSAGAAGANPVLGHAQGLRRTGTGRIYLSVRAARTDELGELRVPHRQAAEHEPPVERERLGFE